ncbi:monosaccharide ABC transporter membrane protein (CUT2 family) [Rhizobium sp. PP-F2F-G48]|uniref:ABC transporter permease n=1 Tax=Rhizobium sp. PP-F2F-G48 TaxID=2135651 RepID=UPI001042D575|nr:ABC transporter permease [Rhizobium sp. PP-F2F-G48]TCM44695.1 monosaccharide ABC transporter membrane protein (CUT2 family) [Rhizobium sp. PP-F2F-G48]
MATKSRHQPDVIARIGNWDNFLAAITIVVIVYAIFEVPNFATTFNISQAVAGISERALIALPMVLLIIAREIDLSVGSTLALTSVVFGLLVQAGIPLYLAIALTLVAGAACGAFNGVLVTALGLPSLVVTLGTMALFRGIGYILLGSGSINDFPESFLDFGIDSVGNTPVPWTVLPFIALAPLFAIALQKMPIGRRIYAIGGSPQAARYSGIGLSRTIFGLFVTSGVVCAAAGMVYAARLANARANNALGIELDVITIALLGGISVFGGKGKLTGVLWALLLFATIRNVLGLLQIGGDAQGTVIGLLLIVSLLVSNAAERIFATVRAQYFQPKAGE